MVDVRGRGLHYRLVVGLVLLLVAGFVSRGVASAQTYVIDSATEYNTNATALTVNGILDRLSGFHNDSNNNFNSLGVKLDNVNSGLYSVGGHTETAVQRLEVIRDLLNTAGPLDVRLSGLRDKIDLFYVQAHTDQLSAQALLDAISDQVSCVETAVGQASAQAHSDAEAAHLDFVQIGANQVSIGTQAHSDAAGVLQGIGDSKLQAHTDAVDAAQRASTLISDVEALKLQSHGDILDLGNRVVGGGSKTLSDIHYSSESSREGNWQRLDVGNLRLYDIGVAQGTTNERLNWLHNDLNTVHGDLTVAAVQAHADAEASRFVLNAINTQQSNDFVANRSDWERNHNDNIDLKGAVNAFSERNHADHGATKDLLDLRLSAVQTEVYQQGGNVAAATNGVKNAVNDLKTSHDSAFLQMFTRIGDWWWWCIGVKDLVWSELGKVEGLFDFINDFGRAQGPVLLAGLIEGVNDLLSLPLAVLPTSPLSYACENIDWLKYVDVFFPLSLLSIYANFLALVVVAKLSMVVYRWLKLAR